MKTITAFIIFASICFVYMVPGEAATWATVAKLGGEFTRVNSIIQAPDGVIYAASSGGIFKATDGDTNWTEISGLRTPYMILTSEGIFYAAGEYAGVYKSIDSGGSWEWTGEYDLSEVEVYCLLETTDGAVYAGTWNGVYKTIDGGNNWEKTGYLDPNELDQPSVYSLLETTDGTIYAGSLYNVYKTTDGGINWRKTADLEGATSHGTYHVYCLLRSSDGAIYAGSGLFPGRVYKTTDGGINWERTAELNGSSDIHCLLQLSDGAIYAATGWNGDIFRTTDFGTNWEDMGPLYSSLDSDTCSVLCLLQTKDGALYAGTSYGSILKLERNEKASLEIRVSSCIAWTGYPYSLKIIAMPINKSFDAWAILRLRDEWDGPASYYFFKLGKLNKVYKGIYPLIGNVRALNQSYTTTLFSVSSLSPWVRSNFDRGKIIVALTPAGERPVDLKGNINNIPGYIDIKNLWY